MMTLLFPPLLRPDAFGVVQDFLSHAFTMQDSVGVLEHAPVRRIGTC
jgi:hypothetical protein